MPSQSVSAAKPPTGSAPVVQRPPSGYGARVLLEDMIRAAGEVFAAKARQAAGAEAVGPFRCVACHSDRAHELFSEEIPEAFGHHVVRCDECGLVSTHPMPSLENLPGFYGDVYYGAENAKFGPLTEIFIFLFRIARLRALRTMGIKDGAVLDVGCGRGLFLHLIQRAGYVGWGTELSEKSAAAARRVIGDRLRIGPVVECGFGEAQFDAITAWQVFEHLHDPDVTLRELHRIMRPGGALVLSQPNIDSWQARWSGAHWFHLDVPRHLYHYSPHTLEAMLKAHGFDVESTSHYSLEQNPFGLLQSALHRLGRPHFGLYDLLRGPMDKVSRSRWQRLPGYGVYLAVFPFAVAASGFWSLIGSGATFTVLARRVD
jgi:2-polyprenyl-3-methyl-5-hydroxy-6-metoxy-1,4-benzoquinol methylase